MSKKTWEIVFQEIKKNQPIRNKDIAKNLNLTNGQVSGALSTIRKKKIVEQLEDKSYIVREKPREELLRDDLEKLLKKYSKPTEKDSDEYRYVYKAMSELI